MPRHEAEMQENLLAATADYGPVAMLRPYPTLTLPGRSPANLWSRSERAENQVNEIEGLRDAYDGREDAA